MKIVFDARWIKAQSSGIGVYAREIMRRLPALAPGYEVVFLTREMFAHGPMSWKSQLLLPGYLDRIGADVFHSPNYMVPYLWRGKIVANIHDVIPLAVGGYAPKSLTSRLKWLYKWCLKMTVRRASAVVTVSMSARDDLVRVLGLKGGEVEKIKVVYNGADVGIEQNREIAKLRNRGICDGGENDRRGCLSYIDRPVACRTLLYVGRMDPYKNVPGLVCAFADAKKRVAFPLKLVIAGSHDPRYPDARAEAERLGVAEDVVFTGHVSDTELAALYRESDLLTHFSSYEGFGLPIVEAMRAGLPVICTDGGSQPEVAGGAAEVVKAGDESAMTGAMVDLLNDPARMDKMREAGYARAGFFTWDKCAAETVKLFNS